MLLAEEPPYAPKMLLVAETDGLVLLYKYNRNTRLEVEVYNSDDKNFYSFGFYPPDVHIVSLTLRFSPYLTNQRCVFRQSGMIFVELSG